MKVLSRPYSLVILYSLFIHNLELRLVTSKLHSLILSDAHRHNKRKQISLYISSKLGFDKEEMTCYSLSYMCIFNFNLVLNLDLVFP